MIDLVGVCSEIVDLTGRGENDAALRLHGDGGSCRAGRTSTSTPRWLSKTDLSKKAKKLTKLQKECLKDHIRWAMFYEFAERKFIGRFSH